MTSQDPNLGNDSDLFRQWVVAGGTAPLATIPH